MRMHSTKWTLTTERPIFVLICTFNVLTVVTTYIGFPTFMHLRNAISRFSVQLTEVIKYP